MLKKLNFSKKYKRKILSGEKTSTIRLKTKLKKGDLVEIIAGGEKLGKARIMNVKKTILKNLTKSDAIKDGFKSKKSLIKALKKHYSNIDKDSIVYIISFSMLKE